jgi:hypothetical protein
MFLAFLVDQIQELSCLTFKKLVQKFKQKSRMWRKFDICFEMIEFTDWDQFYYRLYYNEMPPQTG